MFMARELNRSGSIIITYSARERMIYHEDVINPGQHYNTSTGQYTCPVTGVYLFTYSVYGDNINSGFSNSSASLSLYKEGVLISSMFFMNRNSEFIDITLSRSDIVQCKEREKVWVQGRNDKNIVWGDRFFNIFNVQ